MVTGDMATRMRVLKEQSFRLNGLSGDRVQNALTVYYREMIANLVESLRAHISSSQRLPKLDQSIPLVLSGGTAMPHGLSGPVHESAQRARLPGAALRGADVGGPAELDRARRADGGALLAQVRRLCGATRLPYGPWVGPARGKDRGPGPPAEVSEDDGAARRRA